MIFAPLCSEENVVHLGHMIELYLLDFKDLHSQESIIPKMHYLVHYPALIMRYVHTHNSMMGNQSAYRYGPLSSLWCMRFEAKNGYFKCMAQTIGNFKKYCQNSCN